MIHLSNRLFLKPKRLKMNWFSKLADSAKGVSVKLPSLPGFNHNLVNIAEQVLVALAAAFLFGIGERFVPYYVTVAALVIGGGVGAWFAGRFKVGVYTFLGLSAFYFSLGQPLLVLGLSVLTAVGATVATFAFSGSAFGKRLGLSLGAGAAALALTLGIYYVLLVFVLPAAMPLTNWLYNISPALLVAPTLLIAGYCAFRQPADQRSWYWVATPLLALIFCVYNWPSHSYVGAGVNVLVGIALSVFAWYSRPTDLNPGRGPALRSLGATSVAGLAFLGLFTLSNHWEWLYKFNMASAIEIQDAGTSKIPDTNNTRLVPKVAALDFCQQQNPESFVNLSQDPHPVVRVDPASGERHVYWQCLRHPARLRGHLLYATGGVDGTVLADAGERGKFGATLERQFLFGDDSVYTRGAFAARHPGSVAQSALVATDTSGEAYILVPYVSRVMHWGAMIPDLAGVMAVSQQGFIQDYTPEQAARLFPGVPLFPAELARDYAELWGERASIFAMIWSGNQYEVSEFKKDSPNHYPFWQDFKGAGLRGTIPFEPIGTQATITAAVGLFNPARLQMTVYNTTDLRIPGPKQTQANPGLTRPGLFNLQTTEALLVVRDGRIFWDLALLQPDRANQLHGYAMNIMVDANGQDYCDVVSAAQLNACLDRAMRGQRMQDLGQQLIAPSAPVAPATTAPLAPPR